MARGMRLMLDNPDSRAIPRNLRHLGGQAGNEAEQVQRYLLGDVRRYQRGDAGLRTRAREPISDSGRAAGRAVDTLSRRVAAARDGARAETYHRLAWLLAPPRPTRLDGLLDVDDELGMTRLAWLRRGATAATPEVLEADLAKVEFLRGHGADRLDLSTLPAGRRRMLAETGRRSTNQALQRADVDRRYPILLATLAETYVEVLDELV
jgi:hypothetical protein